MSEKNDDTPSVENVEKGSKHEQQLVEFSGHGIPSESRNPDDKHDPMNWPYWLKVYIALVVSGLGFVNQLGSALINPAFVLIAEDLHISVEQASCKSPFLQKAVQANRDSQIAPPWSSCSWVLCPCSSSPFPTCTAGGSYT